MLHHGEGVIKQLGGALSGYSGNVLLVTGNKSFESSDAYTYVMDQLGRLKLNVNQFRIPREPSPALIDEAVNRFREHRPEVVVAIGGGSVVDAAKAISAMLTVGEPAKAYLEGVGSRSHPGSRLPFIVLPTTSGTGSEATRNAVLSEVGPDGYKRSLRHVNFVPDIAILDPALSLSCPPAVTAASGMDAFSQLLESFLSTAANPITDALAWQGLKLVSQSLVAAWRDGGNSQARSEMALAAYLSGITLANAGLGTVHGLAGVVGGLKDIPHGVICSRLMGPANEITVRQLRETSGSDQALSKYASAGRLFSPDDSKTDSYYVDAFLDVIHTWTSLMGLPYLNGYNVNESDLRRFATLGDNKNNPVQLNEEERYELLLKAWK